MDSAYYWQMFMTTGAPAYYLAYQASRQSEDSDVSENTRSCAPTDGVQ